MLFEREGNTQRGVNLRKGLGCSYHIIKRVDPFCEMNEGMLTHM